MTPMIFDLDGTLIDSAPSIHKVANEVLALKGLPPLSFSQIRSFIGNGVGVLVNRTLAASGVADDPDLHAWMVAEFSARYECEHSLTTLYPGAREALAALAEAGHPLALCTNKPLGPTRSALSHFGLADFFPVVVAGDSLPQRKPDPAPLLHAASQIGPARPIFVGDSEVDAETASRAAIPFALFTGGYRQTPVEQIPHAAAFETLTGLPALIVDLSRGNQPTGYKTG